jgi:hypothetical protein
MLSLNGIVRDFEVKDFSLIKIDIEGGEEGLFTGPTEWLNRTDAIIMEFHPATVNCAPLVEIVCSHGFRHSLTFLDPRQPGLLHSPKPR